MACCIRMAFRCRWSPGCCNCCCCCTAAVMEQMSNVAMLFTRTGWLHATTAVLLLEDRTAAVTNPHQSFARLRWLGKKILQVHITPQEAQSYYCCCAHSWTAGLFVPAVSLCAWNTCHEGKKLPRAAWGSYDTWLNHHALLTVPASFSLSLSHTHSPLSLQ